MIALNLKPFAFLDERGRLYKIETHQGVAWIFYWDLEHGYWSPFRPTRHDELECYAKYPLPDSQFAELEKKHGESVKRVGA
jgi:hypothetical protein